MTARLLTGDCREVLATLPADSIEACVCDPPYELSNDGKASPYRVLAELMFPKQTQIEPMLSSRDEFPFLISKILALRGARVAPGPSASVPVTTVTLDDQPPPPDDDIEHEVELTVAATDGNRLLNGESETPEYLGCFALKLADTAALFQTLDSLGSGFLSGAIGIGFRVEPARISALLSRCPPVVLSDEDVGPRNDALTDAICALVRAACIPVVRLQLGRDANESFVTHGALLLCAALSVSGAQLVRADTGARRLPSELETRSVRVIDDETHRTLSFDLLVHPQNVVSRGFMGKEWDGSKIAHNVDVWREVYRVLKPGAHLLAFGGTRTYHRVVCAIEDAGFEIREALMWHYGQGFPKSLDVSKALAEGGARCVCDEAVCDMSPRMDAGDALPGDAKQDMRPGLRRTQDQRKQDRKDSRSAQHSMREVWDAGASSAEPREEVADVVLRTLMPGENVCASPDAVRGEHEGTQASAEVWGEQPGMEGRRDAEARKGELHRGAVCESRYVGAADGAQGRLHHGAPAGDGETLRVSPDTHGSGRPSGPSPLEQLPGESPAVSDERGSQAWGGWLVCGRCGKPNIPAGLGTALKPATEIICLARKPFPGTVAQNVQRYGTGALNIDACRIAGESPSIDRRESAASSGNSPGRPGEYGHTLQDRTTHERYTQARAGEQLGRWPANLLHDGSEEVLAGFPDAPGAECDVTGDEPSGKIADVFGDFAGRTPLAARGDSGSAARFFYVAKASREDREDGLAHVTPSSFAMGNAAESAMDYAAQSIGLNRVTQVRNQHPTVKPTELMRYLCRLITPPGGTVLDPFMGSGSTGRGAFAEGFDFIGIEKDAQWIPIAEARIRAIAPLFAQVVCA